MRVTTQMAFRPATKANHKVMISTYVAFCLHFNLRDLEPDTETVCLYIQFLARTFASPQSIKNYISAVNLYHHMALKAPPARTFAVSIMLRAINMTLRHIPTKKLPITSELLQNICDICDKQSPYGITLKAAFLLLFFSFLRQSNLGPKSSKKFDHTRHLAVADLFFSPPGYVLFVKWTKTIQHGRYVLLPVPQLSHRHCPVKAIKKMLNQKPKNFTKQSPLFTMPNSNVPMTTCYLTEAFKIIMQALGAPPTAYSLHSFRRGGASEAYQAGVDYAQIKSHGIWQSDSFWGYISTSTLSSKVPEALAATFDRQPSS